MNWDMSLMQIVTDIIKKLFLKNFKNYIKKKDKIK